MNISQASLFLFISLLAFTACGQNAKHESKSVVETKKLSLGVERTSVYFPKLEGKRIAFVGNHTSLLGKKHLVDSLLNADFQITKVFSPEHGFRGKADAGEKVKDGKDTKTGLPIYSLYGNNKKPSSEQLKNIDLILFDIQDVGARFYTYISTLHYVMEAAAEANIPILVLDRPNPNGHYVDGPVLVEKFQSFVGMHPIPVVHGMTIGEYAKMINGEKWLKNGLKAQLEVIACENYEHKDSYQVRVPPSPNLPNMAAIYLYPSLCFFEGTPISVGRGTTKPFQQFGHPALTEYQYHFVPKPSPGAKSPKLQGKKCLGKDLSDRPIGSLKAKAELDLTYLIDVYREYPDKNNFFTSFFSLLAGTDELQKQIKAGQSESEIRASWQSELEAFKKVREKYLLYP
ncbi:MAG: DUF1343 domain-containing protein [Vicingaceae bacterium]